MSAVPLVGTERACAAAIRSAAVGRNQTRVLRRKQSGEQIATPDRRLTTTPRCASGHGYFSPRATEEGKATEGHRAIIGIGRRRLRALPVFLGGPRWLCLPRWLSVRNLAGCRSRAGRQWQNATSPARHSSSAPAPWLGRTSEPEPTKLEARLKSVRLARIFQASSAEDRLARTPSPGPVFRLFRWQPADEPASSGLERGNQPLPAVGIHVIKGGTLSGRQSVGDRYQVRSPSSMVPHRRRIPRAYGVPPSGGSADCDANRPSTVRRADRCVSARRWL